MSEIKKYQSQFGAGRNGYRPPNRNKGKLFNTLYILYVRFSPFFGIAMYLGFASGAEQPQMLLPWHVVIWGLLLWAWKHNSNQWAYAVTSPVGKGWFVVVMFTSQFIVAGTLPESPPSAYILAVIMVYVFYWTRGRNTQVPADRYISGAKCSDPK